MEKMIKGNCNGLVHDKSVLENLLMSFRITNAKEKADEIVSEFVSVKDIFNFDLSKYGEEERKICFAVNSYVKALEFIKIYY